MSDADDVKSKAIEIANAGISNAVVDGQSASSISPKELLDVADRLASRSAATAPSRGILFTKLQPPGAF